MDVVLVACVHAAVLANIYLLLKVVRAGKRARHSSWMHDKERHIAVLKQFGISFVAAVLLIEALVRMLRPGHAPIFKPLLVLHLSLVFLLAVVAAIICFRARGDRDARAHRAWVYYGFVPLYTLVLFTGELLLARITFKVLG